MSINTNVYDGCLRSKSVLEAKSIDQLVKLDDRSLREEVYSYYSPRSVFRELWGFRSFPSILVTPVLLLSALSGLCPSNLLLENGGRGVRQVQSLIPPRVSLLIGVS